MNFIKEILTFFILVTSNTITGQNQYSPIAGSIHVASGLSTIADFRTDNNDSYIPLQFGVNTQKFLSEDGFFEFGIRYAQRGIIKHISTSGPGWSSQKGFGIFLKNIDIPLNYYHKILITKGLNTYFNAGISTSYNITDPQIFLNYYVEVPGNYFKKFYLAPQAGLNIYFRDKIRIGLSVSSSITNLIKADHKSEFSELVYYYNANLYPMETILSVNYMLN